MPTNIIGRKVGKIRSSQGLSQEQLAARLARQGWDLSRGTLAKVEAQVRRVSDKELLLLARALGVRTDDLFPVPPKRRR